MGDMAQYHRFLLALAALTFMVFHPVRASACFGKRAQTGDASFHHPRLTAASPRLNIEARDFTIAPHSYHVLHYVDHETHGTANQVAAQVHLTPKLPALAIEDIEASLNTIICTTSTIELHFIRRDLLHEASKELTALPRFTLITSQVGCNGDGERRAYLVSGATTLPDSLVMRLSASPMAWADIFETMTVKFGSSRSTLDYDLRRHEDLRKRQATPTVGSSPAASYPFSQIPPSATKALDLNLTHQLINQNLASFHAQFPQSGKSPVSVAGSGSITIGCKNCTTTGTLDVVHGSFTANGIPKTDNSTENAIDFFQHGFVEMSVNNFATHIELDNTIDLQETVEFTGHLSGEPIFLPGFEIPLIASVGPYFDPQIHGKVVLDAQMAFTYGFDVTVPDRSHIILNFGDLANSTSSGFNETSIVPIPFQASSPQISLNTTLGFKPAIGVGLQLLDGIGTATADTFFNIPQLEVDVVPVTQVNVDCEPVTSSSSSIVNETLSYLFDNLINIIPSVTIDIGAEYDAHIDGICDSPQGNWTKTLKTWSLPTHCLVYDNTSHALVVATLPSGVLASASAAASSAAAGFGSVVAHSANGSLRPGSIAGICVGAIAGVALLAAGGFLLRRQRRRSRAMASSSSESPPGYEATRVEEQYDDDDGHESKTRNYLEVRSFEAPSPLSSILTAADD